MTQSRHDAWSAGEAYDRYMGRWSRRIAPLFLDWLAPPADARWLEVGCGTGALSAEIAERCAPRSLVGLDPSAAFVAQAGAHVPDPRAQFQVGDAQALRFADDSVDVAVSALVLNFVPDRAKAVAEMRRVTRPDGIVAFYVWDYPGGGLEFLSAFWRAAKSLDAAASELDEAARFPFCTSEGVLELARQGGLVAPTAAALETLITFANFDDYWLPFTLGAGPAPGYCTSLDADARDRLRTQLHASLPRRSDGSISFMARAWAVKGRA